MRQWAYCEFVNEKTRQWRSAWERVELEQHRAMLQGGSTLVFIHSKWSVDHHECF